MRAWTSSILAVLVVALAACSTSTPTAEPPTSPTACPSTAGPAPGAGGPPAGAPAMAVAKTVAPSDTSTSTVLDGTGPQIQCGRVQLTAHNDVLYDSPNGVPLKLDVQVPQTPGTKPLVVYITGGGFMVDDKSANLNQRTYVAEQGYIVASIEYRTIRDGATYKETVADVKSAVRYLRAHASEYSINPDKVAVWGQSAGGYLAAMTGATNGVAQFEGTGNPGQSGDVQAVVDQFGSSDFANLASDFDTAMQEATYAPGNFLAQFVIGTGTKLSIKDDATAVTAANPGTYITPSSPPFALLHGSADQLISPTQTLTLHNAIQANGGKSTRYVIKDGGHGDMSFMGGDPNAAKQWSSQQVMGQIVGFFNDNLH